MHQFWFEVYEVKIWKKDQQQIENESRKIIETMVYDENLDFGAAGSEMPVNFSDWHLHIQGDAHSRSFNPNIPSNVNMNGRYDAVLDTPEGVSVAVTVPKKMIIEKNQELSCNRLMAGIPSRHDVRYFIFLVLFRINWSVSTIDEVSKYNWRSEK